MVVDTSALTAILIGEPERDLFEDLILARPNAVTSAVVLVEVSIVMANKRGSDQEELVRELVSELRLEVRPFDAAQARFANEGFRRFGKGRHAASLNFGDCLVYGLAMARGDELLFKGDDFARTDIVPAWRPEAAP